MAQANLSINANLNIQQILSSIKQIRNGLNTLTLPKGLDKQFNTTAAKLEKSLNELSTLSGRELNLDEAKQALKLIQDVQKAGVSFQGIIQNIGNLDLSSIGIKSFLEDFNKIQDAMTKYDQAVEKVKKSKEYISKQKELTSQQKNYDDASEKIRVLNNEIASAESSLVALRQALEGFNTDLPKLDNKISWLESLQKLKQLEGQATSGNQLKTFLGLDEGALKTQIDSLSADIQQKIGGAFVPTDLNDLKDKIQKVLSSGNITDTNFRNLFGGNLKSTQTNKNTISQYAAELKMLIDLIDIFNAKQEKSKAERQDPNLKNQEAALDTEKAITEEIEKENKAREELNRRKEFTEREIKNKENTIAKDTAERIGKEANLSDAEAKISKLKADIEALFSAPDSAALAAWQELIKVFQQAGGDTSNLKIFDIDELNKRLTDLDGSQVEKVRKEFDKINDNVRNASNGLGNLNGFKESLKGAVTTTEQFNKELDTMQNRIQYFFGLNNSIQLLKRGLREAYNTVKELDSAMTETAVVTDFTVSDMWNQLPLYTKTANELGATTLGAYQTMTLFYQQGLKTNEAFQLGTETMKMARIANMEYATATNMMTAALRGFNMTLNETSAKRVNDVYSQLAAITAADTEEIATAMTKTASIANSASMEFETTAAFLSQIIETTREAPETAGTALKTIIARFTEVKKLYDKDQLTGEDSEGEAININKIDAALQSVGLSLKGFLRGEEGLDDILLQLASKWDTLDIATQRYIATMAAGSRQQSRFLAMMSDYDRTLELVDAANNSAGASDKQFEKTLDSLEAKLNKLSNAWDQFTMGLADNKVIKGAVTALTGLLDIINKLTSLPGGGLLKIMLGMSALRGGGTLLQTGVNWLAGTLTGGTGKGAIYKTLEQAGIPNLNKMSEDELSTKYREILGKQFLGPFYGLKDRIKKDRQANLTVAKDLYSKIGIDDIDTISALNGKNIVDAMKLVEKEPKLQAQIMTQYGLYSNFSGKLGTKLAKVGFGTKWGKKAAEGKVAQGFAKHLGLVEAGAGTAAGALASLAAVLGVVAAVAVGVAAAIKVIDALTINAKEAEESAERISEVKATARDNKQNYVEQIQLYRDLQKTLKSTVKGTTKWNNALNQNNSLVLSLADRFSDLEYIFDESTGAFELTNADIVGQRVSENLENSEIISPLAEAFNFYKQAKDSDKKAIRAGKRAYVFGSDRLTGEAENLQRIADRERSNQVKSDILSKEQFKSAISQMDFSNEEIGENLGSALTDSLMDSYIKDVENIQRRWIGSRDGPRARELASLYGMTIDEVYKKWGDGKNLNNQLSRIAIAEAQAAENLKIKVSNIANELDKLSEKGISKTVVSSMNKLMSGSYQEPAAALSFTKDQVDNYLAALNDIDLEQATKEQKKLIEEQASQFYQNYFDVLTEQTIATASASDLIGGNFKSLSLDSQLALANLLTNVSEAFGPNGEELFATIFQGLPKDELSKTITDISSAYNKIDFSKPILAFKQIQDYANSSNENISELGTTLLEMENADAVFGTTAQFGYLYENIFSSDENIQDLLDDFGKLDADDIYDLADSFSEVEDFLNESKVTASGLAKALNEINNNGLNANLVDKGFLEAMSQADSYTSNMLDTIKKLDDIDLGTDFGQVADTFKDWAEQWKEMINNGELGNQQVAKMYDFFHGTGAWTKIASQGLDVVKTEAIDFYNTLNDISERGNMAMIWKDILGAGGITGKDLNFSAVWDEANQQVLWEIKNGASYDEIAAEVKKKLAKAGLSEELVPYLLTDAANFSLGLAQLVDSQGFESALNILFDNIKKSGKKVVDQAQLDAIINSANDQKAAKEFAEEMLGKYDFTVDEWTGETLFKGLEAGFKDAANAAEGYEKALADTFTTIREEGKPDLIQFDLEEALKYASIEDIFAQLPTIAKDASATSVEIISGEFEGITIDWADVFNNYGGDFGRWMDDQIEAKQLEKYASAITEAWTNAITKLGDNVKINGKIIDSESIRTTLSNAITSATPSKLTIPLSISGASSSVTIGGTSIPVVIKPSEAKGGYVPSYAAGSGKNKISKGIALTGEEEPEIVWNKEKGYAYLAGANGPEYNNLQPGDRVFNAEETKKILRNSKRNKRPSLANGGLITPSYAGAITDSYKPKDWIGGGNSAAVSKDGKEDKEKWKNEFDWLYNLLEDIAELERDQNKLNEKYEDYLEDINKTAADLVKITTQELSNLYAQQARQQLSYDRRIQEMNEYLAVNSDLAQYGRYNFDDMTIEIDWDAIEAVQDQELYSKIEDYVEGLEDIQDKIDEADDALIDIENDIQDIEQRFQEEYVDFENRILDAIVNSRKQQIDQLSEINDSIKDTNSKLLDAVQKSLEQQRQDRENQKTEDEIAEKERRLSFLRQDTSRDNTLDILALEDELKDLKEDYTDELIDQKLTLLQDQEDFAAEQRERQIALMESQLDYDKETGQMWEEINTLIQSSIGSDGKLINDSALANLLRDTENWASLSDVQKQLWEDTLITDFNAAYAYVLMQGVDQVKLKMNEITNMMDTIAKSLPNYSQAKEKNATDSSGGGGSNSGPGGPSPNPDKDKDEDTSPVNKKWSIYVGSTLKGTYTSYEEANSQLSSMRKTADSNYKKAQTKYEIALRKQQATDNAKTRADVIAARKVVQNAKTYLDQLLNNASIKAVGINGGITISKYATGGLNTTTGPAWLDGTKSKPELVLNAKDTQNFLALKDILSDVMKSSTSTDSNSQKGDTYIDISVQAELSNDYDVEQLTKKIKDEIYKDGSYRGVNIIRKIR